MMRTCLVAILAMILTGCASGRSDEALCEGTEADRTALAAALVVDGGPESRASGRTLIARLDAGCGG